MGDTTISHEPLIGRSSPEEGYHSWSLNATESEHFKLESLDATDSDGYRNNDEVRILALSGLS